jgi:hypothetical protein
VISPILSNIYLHAFDQWVETTLIPEYTRGELRKRNPAYSQLSRRLGKMRRTGQTAGIKEVVKQRRSLPALDPNDDAYRRLRYVRYADDFLLGFAGPKSEAEDIKRRIKEWLGDNLALTLSDEKTLITHASTQKARFLGYDISTGYEDKWLSARKRRDINGSIQLRVPAKVIETKCAQYMRNGKPAHRTTLLQESDYTIVTTYQQEYRGIVQYYALAQNVAWFNKLHWVMRMALLRTLAAKHNASASTMLEKCRATTTDEHTGRTLACLEVRVEREGKSPLIARFGGISLTPKPTATLSDTPYAARSGRTELLQRLLADECELCGSREDVEVHHIRKLADLKQKGRKEKDTWAKVMAARQRKTLVVCRQCHMAIHSGKPTRQRDTE